MKPAFLLLAFALLFVACGTSKPEQVIVAERYISAQAAGDWKGMCEEMSQQSQRAVWLSFKGETCADALRGAPQNVRDNLRDFAASVESIEEAGIGSVRLQTKESSPKLEMIREGGKWRVSPV